ncbi:hypothetical protein KKA02_00790 [Patescibacteria group bacterium]|nr:hypothetical protein [Patescibacteria group bacterium]MCG2702700.1 hypothetical protein [Candidatus Parcubacteria bacterium]MBU4210769.1 hypothetical protein [Patescibacteria group bacterium]MBU4265315.1 hypothetical protein [Patescibacteria group bacterium]MBU4390000.1 hypothetical protein [Patescibacteria group bacterium]
MRQKAFTFIEMITVLGLFVLLLSGGMVYMNDFKGRQDLGIAKDELINKLRLARNLARTGQKPEGITDDFSYIEVLLDEDGFMTVSTDIGNSYFSEDIIPANVRVETSIEEGELLFLIRDAKLLRYDGELIPSGVGESVAITLVSIEDELNTETVIIRSSGLIEND